MVKQGKDVIIRAELPQDIPAIRTINEQAFEGTQEADIVDALRQKCDYLISLVAVLEERPVGHILFSPVKIESPRGVVSGMGLGPMAVLPEYQRIGIGSRLVRAGLDILEQGPTPFVIVLGHPEYYPRFGFERASAHGIYSQWKGIPEDAFMALVLNETIMKDVTGIARYRSEFDESV